MKNVSVTRTGTSRQAMGNTGYRGQGSEKYYYVDGNTVRKVRVEKKEENTASHYDRGLNTGRVKKRKVKIAPMNRKYVGAMIFFVSAVMLLLIRYVNLQSSITNHTNNISRLEREWNELKLSNDELKTKIESSVDLEEIKNIAVNELGMKYAKEGQVVSYSGEGNDYVRQYSSIP